jgi:hypothetical protein
MKRSRFLFVVLLLIAPAVLAQPAHSVWSNKPLYVYDGATGAHYSAFVKGSAAFAWNQGTTTAYARAVGVINANLKYDFRLVATTGLTTADEIDGKFDIFRNGVNVCHLCIGKAYLLSQPALPGKYFKIYVGTPAAFAEKWHYSGYITSRFDF